LYFIRNLGVIPKIPVTLKGEGGKSQRLFLLSEILFSMLSEKNCLVARFDFNRYFSIRGHSNNT
jgi:hypothetical protein